MDTIDQAQGYGKFEEAAHELERAEAEKVEAASRAARRAKADGMAALSRTVRTRPVTSMLLACAAGYALGWLSRD